MCHRAPRPPNGAPWPCPLSRHPPSTQQPREPCCTQAGHAAPATGAPPLEEQLQVKTSVTRVPAPPPQVSLPPGLRSCHTHQPRSEANPGLCLDHPAPARGGRPLTSRKPPLWGVPWPPDHHEALATCRNHPPRARALCSEQLPPPASPPSAALLPLRLPRAHPKPCGSPDCRRLHPLPRLQQRELILRTTHAK